MTATEIFNGSNAEQTKEFYKTLDEIGPKGRVATALLRASKCSSRAKQYRKRIWKTDAYDRKQWSLREACKVLVHFGKQLGINYGWRQDTNVVFGSRHCDEKITSWVLYVDLPNGQVSFHDKSRGEGPEYLGKWDGQLGASPQRIIEFCDSVLKENNNAEKKKSANIC